MLAVLWRHGILNKSFLLSIALSYHLKVFSQQAYVFSPYKFDLITELFSFQSAIIGMLRYTLEHADRNIPQKSYVMNKVCVISLNL
jgi:hypothetical protein